MEQKKEKRVFWQPLKDGDTAEQTIGCRHTHPDNCRNNGLERVCAFVRTDGICYHPPASWAKQFVILKERDQGEK